MKHVRGMEAVILQLIESYQPFKENDYALYLSYSHDNLGLPYLETNIYLIIEKMINHKSTFDRVLRKVREKAHNNEYPDSELYALSEREWVRRHGLERRVVEEIENL